MNYGSRPIYFSQVSLIVDIQFILRLSSQFMLVQDPDRLYFDLDRGGHGLSRVDVKPHHPDLGKGACLTV
jgi:hypothetical protein